MNRAPISYEMSTEGRGTITPAERGNEIGPQNDLRQVEARGDRFAEVDSWSDGPTGDVGGNEV